MSGKRGKNDAADAAAIREAVSRSAMRFVPVKTLEQQSELFLHRAHQGYVEQRTALINRIRDLLSELSIVLPQKAETIRRELVHLLEDLPGHCNTVAADAITDLERLDARVAEYDRHIAQCAKANADAKRLMQLTGIGPTTASALVASIGDGLPRNQTRRSAFQTDHDRQQHRAHGPNTVRGAARGSAMKRESVFDAPHGTGIALETPRIQYRPAFDWLVDAVTFRARG